MGVDEWKRQHADVVQKFDALDVVEFKRLKDESNKFDETRKNWQKRVSKAEEELKLCKKLADESKAHKEENENLKNSLRDEKQKWDLKEKKLQGDLKRFQ